MKLIIVDDEKLTRSGLISSIDWGALGIEKVLEASNGSEGIRLAVEEHPDIILTEDHTLMALGEYKALQKCFKI